MTLWDFYRPSLILETRVVQREKDVFIITQIIVGHQPILVLSDCILLRAVIERLPPSLGAPEDTAVIEMGNRWRGILMIGKLQIGDYPMDDVTLTPGAFPGI